MHETHLLQNQSEKRLDDLHSLNRAISHDIVKHRLLAIMGTPENASKAYASPPPSTEKSKTSAINRDSTSPRQLPPAPNPSTDPGITPKAPTIIDEDLSEYLADDAEIDIFKIQPMIALKLMCRSIENLVHITGDVPPTPPLNLGKDPTIDLNHLEEIVHIQSNGEDLVDESPEDLASPVGEDGAPVRKTPIGSPEAAHSEPFPIIGEHTESAILQHNAITRKFYSKKPPPISLEDYLCRIHKYCPMSTAVYLAVSLYVWRLAVVEHVMPVTRRNVHRLLLAGLRVGMKALEDHSFHHSRFARVGGVSELELARLEISFCFVTDFELKVDADMLTEQAGALRDFANFQSQADFKPKLPPVRDKRKASSSLAARPRPVVLDV